MATNLIQLHAVILVVKSLPTQRSPSARRKIVAERTPEVAAVSRERRIEMRTAKVIAIIAAVLMVAGLVLGTGCSSQGPAGPTGATGAQGPKGDTGPQGPSGGLAWGTPVSYGPYQYWMLSKGVGFTLWSIPLQPGDRVLFTITGADCGYSWVGVTDPYDNVVYIYNSNEASNEFTNDLGIQHDGRYFTRASDSGQGAFVAAASGNYTLGISDVDGSETATPLTFSYTVYPVK